MAQIINERMVDKARKEHRCDVCGCYIEKGDSYIDRTCKDDYIFHFRAHKDCDFVYTKMDEFIQPWDGMDEDTFNESLWEFWHTFICGSINDGKGCCHIDFCSDNCWDDCPCGIDMMGKTEKIDIIYNILQNCDMEEYFDKKTHYNKWRLVSKNQPNMQVTYRCIEDKTPQKQFEWIINPDGYYPYCSRCYFEPNRADVIKDGLPKVCPNCKAQMCGIEGGKECLK